MDELIQSEEGQEEIQMIQQQQQEKGNGSGQRGLEYSGCTANIVLITPEKVYCANIGVSKTVGSINKEAI